MENKKESKKQLLEGFTKPSNWFKYVLVAILLIALYSVSITGSDDPITAVFVSAGIAWAAGIIGWFLKMNDWTFRRLVRKDGIEEYLINREKARQNGTLGEFEKKYSAPSKINDVMRDLIKNS